MKWSLLFEWPFDFGNDGLWFGLTTRMTAIMIGPWDLACVV